MASCAAIDLEDSIGNFKLVLIYLEAEMFKPAGSPTKHE